MTIACSVACFVAVFHKQSLTTALSYITTAEQLQALADLQGGVGGFS